MATPRSIKEVFDSIKDKTATGKTEEKKEHFHKPRLAKQQAHHASARLNRLRQNTANALPKDKLQRERVRCGSITPKPRRRVVDTQLVPVVSSRDIVQENEDTIADSSLHSIHHSKHNVQCHAPESKASLHGHKGRRISLAYHSEKRQAAPTIGKPQRKRFGKVSRISPKAQWKRIVRKIINENIHKETDSAAGGAIGTKKNAQGVQQPFFDKNVFKVNKNRGLTSVEKRVLQKQPQDRTDEDLMTLKNVVDRLKCFDKYTRVVKRDLSRVIFYMTLDAGRYIIKQGHDGFSFYFIVSGRVQVRISDINKDTGERYEFAVGEMAEGTSFGELALMHNIKRTASIVCIANGSEFLRVERHDFETVLRMSTEKEWNDRLNMLRWLPQFKTFSEEELDELNQHCKVQEYQSGRLIVGDINTEQDTMLFVASGVCSLVRDLTIVKEKVQFGGEKLHLIEDMTAADRLMFPTGILTQRRVAASRFLKPERHLWSVGDVGKGFYFGVGEDLSHTYVTAKGRVEILEVRRIKFVKNGRWKLVEKMKEEFNKAMPSNKTLFKKYMEDSRWDHYKQKLVYDVTSKRNVENITEWEDVPMALKSNSLRAGSLQRSLQIKF